MATLDWSFSHGRDYGSPAIPDQLDLKTMVKFAPQVLTRPRWLAPWAKTRRLPELTVPSNGQPGVENVLDIFRSGIDSGLMGLGRSSVHELGRADLLVPEGFERRLGVAGELVG
jgi:hypothetical protein